MGGLRSRPSGPLPAVYERTFHDPSEATLPTIRPPSIRAASMPREAANRDAWASVARSGRSLEAGVQARS